MSATKWGEWLDDAVIRILRLDERGNGDRAELAQPLRFIDSDGTLCTVPAGFEFDGASIPPWAWAWIGAPLEGPYVRSAALHDHGCRTRTEPARTVHDRFHRSMRAEGVAQWRAWLMHRAVRHFGPTWDVA